MFYGRGFGFRGSSPPWPYAGRGRGGLPRCGYFYGWAPGVPPFAPAVPFGPPASAGDELESLKNQAEAMKRDIERVEARIRDLEAGR